jgi:hypothetical protein
MGYLGFAIRLSLVTLVALKRQWGFPAACVLSLCWVAYAPYNIFAFSYNTVGMQSFGAGMFCGYYLANSTGSLSPSRYFVVGVLLGVAMTAYPPLALAAPVCVLNLLIVTRSAAVLLWLGAGCAAVPVALVCLLGPEGVHYMLRSFASASAVAPDGAKYYKVWVNLWELYKFTAKEWWYFAAVLAIFAVGRIKFAIFRPLPALLLLTLLPVERSEYHHENLCVILIAYFAVISIVFLWKQTAARNLFLLVWMPSLVGGYLTAVSSTNPPGNMAIGIMPGMVASVALLVLLCRTQPDGEAESSRLCKIVDSLFHVAIPMTVVIIFAVFSCVSVYRDADPDELTTRIQQGPFAGLYTTPQRAAMINDMMASLHDYSRPDDCVLFIYNFPAGYLLTDMPWASNDSWGSASYETMFRTKVRAIKEYWNDGHREPTLIVKLNARWAEYEQKLNYVPGDPYVELLDRYFSLMSTHPHFAIYRRRTDAPPVLELKVR